MDCGYVLHQFRQIAPEVTLEEAFSLIGIITQETTSDLAKKHSEERQASSQAVAEATLFAVRNFSGYQLRNEAAICAKRLKEEFANLSLSGAVAVVNVVRLDQSEEDDNH